MVNSAMDNCGHCNKYASAGAQCSNCNKWFHFRCIGMTKATFVKAFPGSVPWHCKNCPSPRTVSPPKQLQPPKPHSKTPSTPLQPAASPSYSKPKPPAHCPAANKPPQPSTDVQTKNLEVHIKDIEVMLKKATADIADLQNTLSATKQSAEEKTKQAEAEIRGLQHKIAALEPKIANLEAKCKSLEEERLQDRKDLVQLFETRRLRASNLIFKNVPEDTVTNVKTRREIDIRKARKVAEAASPELAPLEICRTQRLGVWASNTAAPRPLRVQFRDASTRDNVLANKGRLQLEWPGIRIEPDQPHPKATEKRSKPPPANPPHPGKPKPAPPKIPNLLSLVVPTPPGLQKSNSISQSTPKKALLPTPPSHPHVYPNYNKPCRVVIPKLPNSVIQMHRETPPPPPNQGNQTHTSQPRKKLKPRTTKRGVSTAAPKNNPSPPEPTRQESEPTSLLPTPRPPPTTPPATTTTHTPPESFTDISNSHAPSPLSSPMSLYHLPSPTAQLDESMSHPTSTSIIISPPQSPLLLPQEPQAMQSHPITTTTHTPPESFTDISNSHSPSPPSSPSPLYHLPEAPLSQSFAEFSWTPLPSPPSTPRHPMKQPKNGILHFGNRPPATTN